MLPPDLAAAADHLAAHRYAEARRICERILAQRPDDPEALHIDGLARFREGDEEGGIDALTQSLDVRPDSVDVLANLGQMQFERGHYEAAHACFLAALDLAPADHTLKFKIGQTLFRAEDYASAEAAYRDVLKQMPDFVPAHYDLGLVLAARGRLPEAIASYEEAARRDPAELDARSRATNLRQTLCDWTGLDRARSEIIAPALRPGFASARPPVPLEVLRLPIPLPAAEFHTIAVNFARAKELIAKPRFRFAAPEPAAATRRLKIGYVSSDFGDHPVGHIVSGLFPHHDRARFETVAYALSPDDRGPERRRLASAVDQLVDLSAESRGDAARRIHADGVDILIDLSGHTKGNGLAVFAHRPAPIQVTWLGFPGTTGTDFIDYLLADAIIAPVAEQPYYTERLVHLPGPYFAIEPEDPGAAPPRAALRLPEQGVVFAAFTLAHKIEPQVFDVWMRLLSRTPGGVLWLRIDNATAQDNLRREAAARGVAPDRLVFAPRLPRREHLARQHAADLFLDTLFYNGHSTVADTLALGIPAVTVHGDRFAARVGASLLRAAGLSELVAASPEEYEALALRLATEPDALAAARSRLAEHKASAPLFDAAGFVRGLEAAYRTMWENYAAGRPPQPFAVA